MQEQSEQSDIIPSAVTSSSSSSNTATSSTTSNSVVVSGPTSGTAQATTTTGSTSKTVTYTFEQLLNKFASLYKLMARQENLMIDSSDVAVGVNQMRTFLDEFVKSK